jgi:aminoglycoside phosphotransferase (APT) family kinase protein
MVTRAPGPAGAGSGGDIAAAVLAHLPGLAPGETPASIEVLPGGLANRSVLVTTRAGRFVVRTHEHRHILGAEARRREVSLHTLASNAGLAPRLVWSGEEADVLVTEYVPGRAWSARDLQDPAQIRRLCASWRTLHGLRAPGIEPFDGVATAKRYRAAIVERDGEDARRLDAAVDEAVQLAEASAGEGRPLTIVHGDPHHANVVEDGSHIVLVDWEYAALADPLVDPGCLLAYYPAARAFAGRILEWSGLAEVADAAALDRVRRQYELLSMLWTRALAAAASGARGPESAD